MRLKNELPKRLSPQPDPRLRLFTPCDASPSQAHLPAKIWELLRRNSGFNKTITRLKELLRNLHSNGRKIKHPRKPVQPVLTGISATHQPIRQILTNFSQRNKYAFTALEWIFPDLRLRWKLKLGSPAEMTCDTPWNKTPDGFKQEFRLLSADLDYQAKLPPWENIRHHILKSKK